MTDQEPKEPKHLTVAQTSYLKAVKLTAQNFEEVLAWLAADYAGESHGSSTSIWVESNYRKFEVKVGGWLVWSDEDGGDNLVFFDDEDDFLQTYQIVRARPHPEFGRIDLLLHNKFWLDTLERQRTGMTLGRLEQRLRELPPDLVIRGVGRPNSYRGYYEDLAFSPEGEITAGKWAEECRGCNGSVFVGYKGGEFTMHSDTAVWIASYGTTSDSRRLLGVNDDGTLHLADREDF